MQALKREWAYGVCGARFPSKYEMDNHKQTQIKDRFHEFTHCSQVKQLPVHMTFCFFYKRKWPFVWSMIGMVTTAREYNFAFSGEGVSFFLFS